MSAPKRPTKGTKLPGIKGQKPEPDLSTQKEGFVDPIIAFETPVFGGGKVAGILDRASKDLGYAKKLVANFDAEVQLLGLNVSEARELKVQLAKITKG